MTTAGETFPVATVFAVSLFAFLALTLVHAMFTQWAFFHLKSALRAETHAKVRQPRVIFLFLKAWQHPDRFDRPVLYAWGAVIALEVLAGITAAVTFCASSQAI